MAPWIVTGMSTPQTINILVTTNKVIVILVTAFIYTFVMYRMLANDMQNMVQRLDDKVTNRVAVQDERIDRLADGE